MSINRLVGLRIAVVSTLLLVFTSLISSAKESMRVETELSESRLYRGEAVCLTVRFFSDTEEIEFVELSRPFEVRGLSLLRVRGTGNRDGLLERKGKGEYQAVVYRAMLLVDDAGEVEIPSIDFRVGIPGYTTYNHPFYGTVRQKYVDEEVISTKPIRKKVSKMPSPPAGYSGAVGSFTIEGSVPPGEIYSGSTALVQYHISGKGFLDDNFAPDVRQSLPEGVTLQSQTADSGAYSDNGNLMSEMVIACLLNVPDPGEFELKPINFVFFDPATRSYRTVSSKPLTITVEESEIPSGPVILHSI